jgi:hypothetical protein
MQKLSAHKGYEFGLWLRTNYGHTTQKEHDESPAMGMKHVSCVNHNFFAIVVGINLEKEISNPEYADNQKSTLSFRAG